MARTNAVGGGPAPAEFQTGEATFNANCSACQGKQAAGTDHGPPLVHKVYEPNHHGDQAFQRAPANGIQAHHWQFGNTPKIDAVTPSDVDQIVKYVRWLQRSLKYSLGGAMTRTSQATIMVSGRNP